MAHIISGCSKLAGSEYTERHNNVALIVYRDKCADYNLEHSKDWWVESERVVRNHHFKILWDFPIKTDKHLASQSAWLCADQLQGTDRLIIDFTVPRDENIQDKELEKVDRYQSLKIELEQLESQNHGYPSSSWYITFNTWQVTCLASLDTENDQAG